MLHEVSPFEEGKSATYISPLLKFKLSEFQKTLWEWKYDFENIQTHETRTPFVPFCTNEQSPFNKLTYNRYFESFY